MSAKKIMKQAYLQIIRPLNLLIVFLTQVIIYKIVIAPPLKEASMDLLFSDFQFYLFTFITVLIAASGYVINDILDCHADQLNKPEKTFIPHKISYQAAWRYYVSIIVMGFLFSLYIGIVTHRIELLWIYVVVVILLYLYSKYLKHINILGNIIVGGFCAFVPGILWFAESENLVQLGSREFDRLNILLFSYLVFAFYSNFIREIIKDIQDLKGDKIAGSRTLPIIIGINKSKIFLIFHHAVLTILITIFWIKMYFLTNNLIASIISLIILLPWIIKIGYKLLELNQVADAKRMSKDLKWMMAAGLIVFILFAYA